MISENVSLPASAQFLFTIGGHPANFIPSEIIPLTKGVEVNRRFKGPPTKDRVKKHKKYEFFLLLERICLGP